MRILSKLAALAAAAGSLAASAANAGVIYQSIPDLTVSPAQLWCSQCASDGQNIGQLFTLASGAVANTLSFAVYNGAGYWPAAVTVDFFQDAGGILGANVYHQTFSSFASDVPTANGTDVVTVDLGSLTLAAGSYDLFMWNPSNLGIPAYTGYGTTQIYEDGAGGTGPSPGDGYAFTTGGAYSSGVSLSGAVPEPAAWAFMLVGFGALGASLRAGRKTATAAA